ncbi:MAG TPA: hypothetical protein PKD54_13950 [Pirellulaceae bacterium]|nr:hypothetical protein [Pirellulaceae bacterium]
MNRLTEKPTPRPMTTWLLEIIGPALLILFLGSFVYLLVLVFYWGPHTLRLQWIMGLFVASAVLVSRISIELGRERAFLYLLPLAAATMITASALVKFDAAPALGMLALLSLIFIILWLADRLTWDTTVIDASRDTSSQGLLSRLRPSWLRRSIRDQSAPQGPEESHSGQEQGQSDAQAGNLIKLLFTTKPANTPGLWVLCTALVTLPAFALGQWFVPADYPGGFGYAKLLFAVHVAAGLGLMTTTSLLGLQRYLNNRRIGLPADVAQTWIIAGGLIAALVLVLIWVAPQFHAQSRLQGTLSWLSAKERPSDKKALGRDGTEQQKRGNSGSESDQNKGSTSGGGRPNGQSGSAGQSSSGQKSGQSGQADQKSQQAGNSSQNSQDQQNQSRSSNQGRQQTSPSETANPSDNTGRQTQTDDDKPPEEPAEESSQAEAKPANPSGGAPSEWSSNRRTESGSGNSPVQIAEVGARAAAIIRWLGIFALVAAAIFFRQELMAILRELWAMWMRLFDKQSKATSSELPHQDTANGRRRNSKPFAAFRNPFRAGLKLSNHQLLIYTFAAVEALAREMGCERLEEETPNEFSARLGSRIPQLNPGVLQLSASYCQSVFGNQQNESLDIDLATFWQLLESHASRA